MSSAVVRTGTIAGVGALFGAANPSFQAMVQSYLPEALASLSAPAVASGAAAATTVVARADDLHAAALAASVKALEAMLQQQRSGGSSARVGLRGLLLIATPVAAGLAIRHYGWARVGWATPAELQSGLASVRDALLARVHALNEAMHARFGKVDDGLADTCRNVQELRSEVEAGLAAVGASVRALDGRFAPIEADVHRTAQGVGLLCEVVSGLPSHTSPELRRRLEDFTGTEARTARTEPPMQPLLPPPSPRDSSFLRALLEPPPGVRTEVPSQ